MRFSGFVEGERSERTAESPAAQLNPQEEDVQWPPDTDPELDQAIRLHRASFVQYIDTWYFSDLKFNRNGEASVR